MKMPTKAELLKLQQRYRTDKRIADALGGNVTEHLVQYWRRKKGIPRTSLPKFSEAQIRELWERFGDDFRCGREIGLSKAGFYSWRRRYGIKEKPRALKLEQLELRFGSEPKMGRNGVFVEYYRTVAEKILARCSGLEHVSRGEDIDVTPDLILLDTKRTNRLLTGPVADKVRIVSGWRQIESGAKSSNVASIDSVYSLLQGEDLVPNMLIVHNSHAAAGLTAFSTLSLFLDDARMRKLMKHGKFPIKVPSVVRLTLQGRLQRGVTAFDIFGYAVSNLSKSVFENRVIEYAGSTTEKLNIFERMSLCHLTPSSGAACGYTVFDETTRRYLAKRGRSDHKVWFSDNKAFYDHDYLLHISGLEPQAIASGDMTSAVKVSELTDVGDVSLVFIGGPCGGGIDAIKQLADIFKGHTVSDSTRLLVSPLNNATYIEAMKRRLLIPIAEAGGIIAPAGFRLEDIPGFDLKTEQTVLMTPYRFDGSFPANCWFVNHLTAAESAIHGKLTAHKR
ncbi:MAG: aconitase family protein [Candidatus Zixiibacteriota bacterium]